ncbi:D-cysteine desulfhydrase family protein [bacterium]|nr:MAG: D-cysteine desulfhydrase family protein [bacterium]
MAPPPKVPLCLLPTPMHRLDRMSKELGIDLWIKRDDLTGFALGGNKGRKLEYLIAEALQTGAEVVVTCGAAQSNFVRQLGAACAMVGLQCVAAVMELPFEDEPAKGQRLRVDAGNVVLDHLLGVELRHFPDDEWETLYAYAETIAVELETQGRKVYRVPIGGSSPLGAYAFYQAAVEIGNDFDWIVSASSSGSTQTGLAYAFHNTKTKVLGICSDPEPEIAEDFADLGQKLARLLSLPYSLPSSNFPLNFDFVGPGYGVPSPEGDAAIERLARTEGIFLDPIYSGKAFAALIDIAKKGEIKGQVLFWHTGGVPTLFAR